jgi:hypothetical protein
VDQRFGFGWLETLATCVHGRADPHMHGTTAHARATIESRVAELVAAGRRGNVPILSIMLTDVCRLLHRLR